MGTLDDAYKAHQTSAAKRQQAAAARSRLFSPTPTTPGILALCHDFVKLVKIPALPIGHLVEVVPGRPHPKNPKSLFATGARFALNVYESTGEEGWHIGAGFTVTSLCQLVPGTRLESMSSKDLRCPSWGNWRTSKPRLRGATRGTLFIGTNDWPAKWSPDMRFIDAHPDRPGKGPFAGIHEAPTIALQEYMLNYLNANRG